MIKDNEKIILTDENVAIVRSWCTDETVVVYKDKNEAKNTMCGLVVNKYNSYLSNRAALEHPNRDNFAERRAPIYIDSDELINWSRVFLKSSTDKSNNCVCVSNGNGKLNITKEKLDTADKERTL